MKKRVIAEWIDKEDQNVIRYRTFKNLLNLCEYVGFISLDHSNQNADNRYKIVTRNGGSNTGIAVNPTGIWANAEHQEVAVGTYFVFDTLNELLDWMKGE